MTVSNLISSPCQSRRGLAIAAGLLAFAVAQITLQAQVTYTVIDLSPTGYSTADTTRGGHVAGYVSDTALGATRATLWSGAGVTNLHPTSVDNAQTGAPGRSGVESMGGSIQVGWAAGVSTGNRAVPMLWRGTAASATQLAVPFASLGGQANATDGQQVGGYGYSISDETGTSGPVLALLWDATTGAVTDLSGGKGSTVFGVGGGRQVGYVLKGNAQAAMWSGTSRSLVVLHPKGATLSSANATDGVRQVGYAGYDIRVRQEAAKGNKTARFNYAMEWRGTAASMIDLHPYPVNVEASVVFTHSYAHAVAGDWIVGWASNQTAINTPGYNHAIVWGPDYQSVDLNRFLPAGFIGSQAFDVDADGIISGVMFRPNGERHAVVWVPNL